MTGDIYTDVLGDLKINGSILVIYESRFPIFGLNKQYAQRILDMMEKLDNEFPER